MLEAGVDLLTISKLMGHASFITTMVYSARAPTALRSQPQSAGLAAGPSVSAVGRATEAQRQREAEHLAGERAAGERRLPRVIDLLRRFTPKFMHGTVRHSKSKACSPKSCSAAPRLFKGHLYKCAGCDSEVNVYNSCTDRHCPQCGGARRADWMDKTAEVILPGVPYFQVVFTLPDKLSSLILGNRSELYSLLFQSAWQALDRELRLCASPKLASNLRKRHLCQRYLQSPPPPWNRPFTALGRNVTMSHSLSHLTNYVYQCRHHRTASSFYRAEPKSLPKSGQSHPRIPEFESHWVM